MRIGVGMALLVGLGIGIVVGGILVGPPSDSGCCARVAAGVKERLGEAIGTDAAGLISDEVYSRTPAVLDLLGV